MPLFTRISLLFICLWASLIASSQEKYYLTNDPIDVVIVTHPKDQTTLNACINGIRENCANIDRVIVVSSKKLTNRAEWFDEANYPFSKQDVSLAIAKGDRKRSEKFSKHKSRGPGWYYQQLLKLYAAYVIPDISSNILVIDSDTIFLNQVFFLNESNGSLFSFARAPLKEAYSVHAKRLIPKYKRFHTDFSSICHHMLFQKPILNDLFNSVEKYHRKLFWKAFCHCVDLEHHAGASEYEIYFQFAFKNTDQVQLRELLWDNSSHLNEKEAYRNAGYHYVSFHTYMRGKWPKKFPEK